MSFAASLLAFCMSANCCCHVAKSFFRLSILVLLALYCCRKAGASSTEALLMAVANLRFSCSNWLICDSNKAILLLASRSFSSSSDRSSSFSVTLVRMAHSLLWALSEPPHSRHLYCVLPCPRVTPSEQVTLMVTLSTPFSLAASVAW